MQKCPYCAEEIQDDAVKCRYCGEWLKKGAEEPKPIKKDINNSSTANNDKNTVSFVAKLEASNYITCPRCGGKAKRGGFKTWQILVAICFFPIGLLALLADREPTKCMDCNHTWQI